MAPDHALDARFAAAQALALEAGALALRLRGGGEAALGITGKGVLDFSTEADRAVERLVGERLAKRFGDSLLGEEYGVLPPEPGGDGAERLWVVDPIDGTFNFARGLPNWCISIALLDRGEIALGIIHNPATGELFTARRGGGAWRNGEALHLASERPAMPLIEIGYSNRRPTDSYLTLIRRTVAAGCEFRRFGSGALGLAAVACGLTDGYIELHINAWDVLAGIVLVREAGGWASDFLADDGLHRGNPIIACKLALRETLEAVMAGQG